MAPTLEEQIISLNNSLTTLTDKINTVDNIITDNRVGIDATAKFIRDHKTAVNTAKDIMFNSRRMKQTQNEIKRTFLHNIYKNIVFVLLLLFAMVLIIYNRKYLKQIIRAIFQLFDQIKDLTQSNLLQARRDMNRINIFNSRLFRDFTRPRRFVFN